MCLLNTELFAIAFVRRSLNSGLREMSCQMQSKQLETLTSLFIARLEFSYIVHPHPHFISCTKETSLKMPWATCIHYALCILQGLTV